MSETEQTLGDFLKVLRASGLVAPESLEPLVAAWRDFSDTVPEELLSELLDQGLVTHWQLEQLRKGKHKGFMLGKYKLLRLLGAGGMSSVYLAQHATLGNQVAIKVLPVKRVDESSYLARFQREAQAAARLNHPNIARVVDLDTAGSVHFMVMEYVEGTDLNAKVKEEGPLEVAEAVEFVRQAALGLHYAHEEGFVHRDIKPANLMVDKRGTIKILDLGLALAQTDDDEQASLTKEHNEKVLGTADYLAPEQATNSHEADRRSDIYSLGCTLYFLLVGKAPYASGSLAQRMRAQVMEPAPNLLEKRSDVPAVIAEIYFRMMEKNPEARQQSAQEVADSLALWLNAQASTANQSRSEAVRRPSGQRRPGGTSTGVKRLPPPPGRVYRSGPGSRSGSDIRVGGSDARRPATPPSSPQASRSDVDLSSLSFTPPPSSASQSTGKLPAITVVSRKTAEPPAVVKVAVKPTAHPAGKPRSGWSPPKLPGVQWPASLSRLGKKQVGGLPLVFWLIVAGAILAAIGLAIVVITR